MNTTATGITRHPAPFAAVAAAVVAFAIGTVAVPTTSSAAAGQCVAKNPPPAPTGQPGHYTGGQVMIGE